jgi:hypothetical protein
MSDDEYEDDFEVDSHDLPSPTDVDAPAVSSKPSWLDDKET